MNAPLGQTQAPGNFSMREITDATFERDVLKHKGLSFVLFYNTSCSACNDMKETLAKIGIAFKSKIEFMQMDVVKNPQFSSMHVKNAMPCSIVFQDGKVIRDTRIMEGQSVWTGNAANIQYFINWINTVVNVADENW